MVPQLLLSALLISAVAIGLMQSLGLLSVGAVKGPSLDYYLDVVRRPATAESLLFSLRTALISSAISVLTGVALSGIWSAAALNGTQAGKIFGGSCLGQGFSRSRSNRGRGLDALMDGLVQLPIIIPHAVTAIFIVNIFSQNGLLARLLFYLGFIGEQQDFPQLIYAGNGVGMILAYLWKEIPFIVFITMSMMNAINGGLGEAARNLGASGLQSFVRITLPLCKNTIAGGFIIVFIYSFGAYELPFLLGPTRPRGIAILAYQEYTHPELAHRPYAMALNGIITLISVGFALAYYLLLSERRRTGTDRGRGADTDMNAGLKMDTAQGGKRQRIPGTVKKAVSETAEVGA